VNRVEKLCPEVGHIVFELSGSHLHVVNPIIGGTQAALTVIDCGLLLSIFVP